MSVRKQPNGKWYYDFGYEGKRYKKKGFKTKREATEAESIARNKLMKGFIINNKTSFIDYYNDWIVVNKRMLLLKNHMPHSKMQLTNSKVLEKSQRYFNV